MLELQNQLWLQLIIKKRKREGKKVPFVHVIAWKTTAHHQGRGEETSLMSSLVL